MKPSSSTKTSVKSDDAPKVTQADFDRAVYRVAGKNVTKPQWQAAMRARLGKQRISIMLDAPIIEHFKPAAGERKVSPSKGGTAPASAPEKRASGPSPSGSRAGRRSSA